ncbi:hypothetical protein [Yimella sp. NH-Cas1]|uniref:hypothetical protein n=1 Tax=Yimella sp. NH-Cas1 TaxID=2917726 RepID=UPI001EFB64B1|nr:hypothetical protein [Yimella sp. NH-Cas1]MCG8655389.1 hypothetical protein [Yimella sp. NH-Cas1]
MSVWVLALCLDFPGAVHGVGEYVDRDDRIAYRLLCTSMGLPVVVLIATVARLSSETRDRRLAALRLMGLGAGRAGLVAAAETAALVAPGTAGGLVAYLLTREPIELHGVRRGWIQRVPEIPWALILVAALLTVALTSFTAARPAARGASQALVQSRSVQPRSIPRWGLTVFVIGLVAALWGGRTDHADPQDAAIWPVFVGLIGCGVGLVAAGAALTELVGRGLQRLPGTTAPFAAARMRADRPATGRAIGGLVIATFVATVGLSTFTIFTRTPQYVDAQWTLRHPTSQLESVGAANVAPVVAHVRTQPGVTGASPAWSHWDGAGMAVSCATLRRVARVSGCSDVRPWVAILDGSSTASMTPKTLRFADRPIRVTPTAGHRVSFPDVVAGGNGPDWSPGGHGTSHLSSVMVVPPSVVQAAGIAPDSVIVSVAAGRHAYSLRHGDVPTSVSDWQNYDKVQGYERMMWLLIGVVMSLGLLTVVVAVLDRMVERRRRVSSLRMMGTPVSMIRNAQFLGVLLPLLVAVLLAVFAGAAVGRAYLALGSATGFLPISRMVGLTAASSMGAIGVAALTVPGLARPLTADLLRRE